ncbi:hypothetical protein JQM68_09925, partial [Oscillibacter valericigenes]|uniref:hypothetical protein n=1 Tax=Oscillibacter valericigenes TaxID=351091 RepID=UPI001F25805A
AWSIVSFNGGNRSSLASEKVNSNKLGLALTPDGGTQVATSTTGNQNLTLKDGEWVIPAGGNLPFECAGIATAVSASASNVEAAKVVFTLAWKAVEYTISMDELTGHYVSTNYNGNTINIIISQQWFEDYGSAHNMTSDELIEVMKQGGTSSTFNDEPFENFEENWDMLTISFRYAGDGTYRFENNTLNFYFDIEVAMV